MSMCLLKFVVFRDADGSVIRPLPRAKRMLSDPSTLPHLVQVKYEYLIIINELVINNYVYE